MENQQLDVDRFTGDAHRQMSFAEHQFTITPRKTPEEITAELEQKRLDAAHQRNRELLLLRATLTLLFLLVGMSMWIVLSKGVTTEEGKLAFGALTTLIGSLLGYFTGKTSK